MDLPAMCWQFVSERAKKLSTRRQVGGYAWQDELGKIKRLGETLTGELVELGRDTRSVESANKVTRLVALSSQISMAAMELREYRENQP